MSVMNSHVLCRAATAGRRLLTVGAAALALGLLVGGQAGAEDVKRGGTLILARPDEPLTFDPFIPGDNGSIYAIEQVCDALIEADETGLGLRPGLAESWEISGDGLTYTFKIRDAKFSNGDPVTVDDVVFTLRKLAQPDTYMSF
jgi:peptide/nickel transport system substrate-binding protein